MDVQGDTAHWFRPPVDMKNKSSVLTWPALTWPGQSGTLVLMLAGGCAQGEWSPFTIMVTIQI